MRSEDGMVEQLWKKVDKNGDMAIKVVVTRSKSTYTWSNGMHQKKADHVEARSALVVVLV